SVSSCMPLPRFAGDFFATTKHSVVGLELSMHAIDLYRSQFAYDNAEPATDPVNEACEHFAVLATTDRLRADDFFAWADKGEASALLHDIIADDDQHQILQLIIKAAQRDEFKRLAGPAIERLYAHAYEHRRKELTK